MSTCSQEDDSDADGGDEEDDESEEEEEDLDSDTDEDDDEDGEWSDEGLEDAARAALEQAAYGEAAGVNDGSCHICAGRFTSVSREGRAP